MGKSTVFVNFQPDCYDSFNWEHSEYSLFITAGMCLWKSNWNHDHVIKEVIKVNSLPWTSQTVILFASTDTVCGHVTLLLRYSWKDFNKILQINIWKWNITLNIYKTAIFWFVLYNCHHSLLLIFMILVVHSEELFNS